VTINKFYNEAGKVAVLYSPGFGAGWSTWNASEFSEFYCQDKTLVEMALNIADEITVKDYIKSVTGQDYVCTLGWPAKVKFLQVGVQYRIEELMKLAWQGYHSKEIKVLTNEHWEEPAFIIQGDEVHIV
jgi:hypothetical protein